MVMEMVVSIVTLVVTLVVVNLVVVNLVVNLVEMMTIHIFLFKTTFQQHLKLSHHPSLGFISMDPSHIGNSNLIIMIFVAIIILTIDNIIIIIKIIIIVMIQALVCNCDLASSWLIYLTIR